MQKEKTWQVIVKETFTKTRDERYAESTKGQKIVYWIFMAIVWGVLLYTFVKAYLLR